MNDCDHKLFLIEFLVEDVKVPSVRMIVDEALPLKTVVSFQILDLPLINIEQEETVDDCLCLNGDAIMFKKGKSCLFALPSYVLQKPLNTFPVTVSVKKIMPTDVLPDVYTLGKKDIQIKDLINSTLADLESGKENPSKAIKDSFQLETETGLKVGHVTAFLRVSCFGKKLITQFQLSRRNKTFLFKGTNESPVFQCAKVTPDTGKEVKCICKPCDDSERRDFGVGEKKSCLELGKSYKNVKACCSENFQL